jgi:cGMP-dependent protein kinase
MGCYSGKSKTVLQTTKPLENRSSLIVTPSIDGNVKQVERRTNKSSNPIADSRIKFESSEAKTAEFQPREKTQKDYEQITKSISTHFLFNSLSDESIRAVVDEFKLYSFGPKENIFSQGCPGQNFYIIASGRVEVIVNGKAKKVMVKGEQFGELALLHDSVRTATVCTVEKTYLWILGGDTFRSIITSLNTKKHEENKHFVNSIPVFSSFSKEQKDSLLSLIITHDFNDGQTIVQEGDPGNLLYIIKKGSVSCSKSGSEIRKLWPGDFFGEQALLYNTPRTATVTAIGKVTLLSLGRDDLHIAFGSHLQTIIYRNSKRIAIEKSSVLKSLNKSQVEAIIDKMDIACYKPGQIVIGRGSCKRNKVFIVLKGTIRSQSKSLGLYCCIGDEEIHKGLTENWEENWVADVETDVATILREDLEGAIGGHLSKVTSQNEVLMVLRRVQLLRSLPLHKLENLVSALKLYEFNDGDVIFEEGAEGDAFYIVKEGQVEILRAGVSIRMITRHDFFGERSIIMDEKRTATVIARDHAFCWSLSKKDFLALIDEGIRKQLSKRMELQNDKIALTELVVVKLLGRGMFGNVFLTFNTKTSVFYALKTVQRNKVIAYDIYDNVVLERKILLSVDHPLIVKLVKTFKDDSRLYFLMEFVHGMDLFDALREMGLLNNESSKFYISCLLLIFEHMHERKIIYRDLKPENVMVDNEGYPKLIDFGTSKIIHARTFTMVGTPHYMAPEIIKGSGYTLSADLWSLGVMLYEFVCGGVPFGEEEEDTFKIYGKILDRHLKYPSYMSSTRCKPIIEKMLDPNPAMRGTVEALKEHAWFNGVSWDGLLGKQIKPPYVPKLDALNAALQKALKTSKGLQEVIRVHEEQDEFVDNGKNKNKVPPANWDDEF